MIAYTGPEYSLSEYLKVLINYSRFKKEVISRISQTYPQRAVYIRDKERHVLGSILRDLGWKGKKIGLPAFTCDSLASAIEISGNIVVFYAVQDNLQIDTESIQWKDLDSIIISEVYGNKVEVPEEVRDNNILLIGDFAHHNNLFFSEFTSYDILLFSSAYYKPIYSSGFGLGVIANLNLPLTNSVRINSSFFPNFFEHMKLGLIQLSLKSNLIKIPYSQSVKGGYSKHAVSEISLDNSAWAISFSQIRVLKSKEVEPNIYKQYKEGLEGIKNLSLLLDSSKGITYMPVICLGIDRDLLVLEMLNNGYLLGRIFGRPAGYDSSGFYETQKIADHVVNLPVLKTEKGIKKLLRIFQRVVKKIENEKANIKVV